MAKRKKEIRFVLICAISAPCDRVTISEFKALLKGIGTGGLEGSLHVKKVGSVIPAPKKKKGTDR